MHGDGYPVLPVHVGVADVFFKIHQTMFRKYDTSLNTNAMFLFFQVDTCHDLFPKAKAQSVVGLVTRAVDKVLVVSSRALSSSFVVGASAHDLFFYHEAVRSLLSLMHRVWSTG